MLKQTKNRIIIIIHFEIIQYTYLDAHICVRACVGVCDLCLCEYVNSLNY